MRSYDVLIAKSGWAQSKRRPSWRPSDRARTNARSGLPWTTVEDHPMLIRLSPKE